MAEIGLVRLAGLALDVSQAVLPSQRTKFSKRQFTQPQLMAMLCLMRYEDWTFREAEVRLSEHAELRSALQLRSVPDYTTLYRFLTRLREEDVAQVLQEIVRRMPGRWESPATVAVDATGLAQSAMSSFFVRRMHHHTQQPMPWKHWLKWLTVVDVDRQLILAQSARQGPWNDCANLHPWSPRRIDIRPWAACWPMPNSTPNAITLFAVNSCKLTASSLPNASPVAVQRECAGRCGRTSLAIDTQNAR